MKAAPRTMAPSEEIDFLREFRSRVQRYLYLGAAPPEDDFMPAAALGKMHLKLEQEPDYRELRREINEDKGRAHQILSNLGVPTLYVQYPAPAIGGPVLRFHLLDLITENRSAEMISLDTFLDKIDEAIGKLKQPQRSPKSPRFSAKVEIDAGFVFIAMPMDPVEPALEDVHDAIKSVALELGLTAERVDDPESNQRITDRILSSLGRAQFVVADLTLGRPNVYYEAGYAHAMGKIPIYIARRGTEIEFDLKDYPVIFFSNMRELRHGLRRRLDALKERY